MSTTDIKYALRRQEAAILTQRCLTCRTMTPESGTFEELPTADHEQPHPGQIKPESAAAGDLY
jgi:hypothetical protein